MKFELINNERSIIKVIGVGGGGSNAVTHMYQQGIIGVDFAICNTDAQAMELSPVPHRIQLGPDLTDGRGAGSKPNVGRQACLESIEEVKKFLEDKTKMLFVTAGMGGGTGTGGAPIIAKAAQELDILTVGIVTLPFTFEGRRRNTQAMEGVEELKKQVDTLIIISNDKLRQIFGNLTMREAFSQADNILTTAAKGIAEIITVPGYVNVDFEDVNTVMRDSGVAIMGTAMAEGDDRARRAVDEALSSPLLEDNDIEGAKHILLNIASGSKEVTMDEVFEITEFVQEEAGYGTDLIWGNCYDESLGDSIAVTVIATGFERSPLGRYIKGENHSDRKIVVSLDDDQTQPNIETTPDPRESGIYDLGDSETGKRTTVEFDAEDLQTRRRALYSYDEPFSEEETKARAQAEKEKRELDAQRRRERMRQLGNVKLNNPRTVSELESEPAFLRHNIRLDEPPHSSEPQMSKWTISDEGEEPSLRANNSFLHKDVD